jgi:GNAT superfamily N-acetyltransferase
MEIIRQEQAGYVITTDKSKMDINAIHQYLSKESYWAENIPVETVERSVEGSLCFGIFWKDEQVGFARVITDCATFAYLADVYVLTPHRGRGLSKWLMEVIMTHPQLQGLRRWMLATLDAHGLYAQFGFQPIDKPERLMGIKNDEVYQPPQSQSQSQS